MGALVEVIGKWILAQQGRGSREVVVACFGKQALAHPSCGLLVRTSSAEVLFPALVLGGRLAAVLYNHALDRGRLSDPHAFSRGHNSN